MRGLTFQQIVDLVANLPEEFRTLTFYKEIVIGWDTLVLKTIDYSLICYMDNEGVKWIKRYTWKTPEFDEVIFDSHLTKES